MIQKLITSRGHLNDPANNVIIKRRKSVPFWEAADKLAAQTKAVSWRQAKRSWFVEKHRDFDGYSSLQRVSCGGFDVELQSTSKTFGKGPSQARDNLDAEICGYFLKGILQVLWRALLFHFIAEITFLLPTKSHQSCRVSNRYKSQRSGRETSLEKPSFFF